MGNNNKRPTAAGNTPAQRGPGGGAGGGGNAVINATQKMKTTITSLEKRRKLLELRANKQKGEALKYKQQGNKKQALMALKRSKLLMNEVEKVDAQMFNLERQQINLEGGSTTQTVVDAMGAGLRAQQVLNRRMNPDLVADQVDQQQELMENQMEVQDILTQDAIDVTNDDELLAELNELESDEVENQAFAEATKPAEEVTTLPTVPDLAPLPKVPQTSVEITPEKKPVLVGSDSDAAAFRELEAELL